MTCHVRLVRAQNYGVQGFQQAQRWGGQQAEGIQAGLWDLCVPAVRKRLCDVLTMSPLRMCLYGNSRCHDPGGFQPEDASVVRYILVAVLERTIQDAGEKINDGAMTGGVRQNTREVRLETDL